MRAGRAGDRDQQSQRRRTRGRAGCAVAHTDCRVGTRPGQCGRCRRARMGPAAAGEATWATSGQESHPTQWPITRLPISPTVSGRFEDGQMSAVSALRQAEMVASDETGVRIEGANAYHGVFRSPEAVVHHAAPTRAASVVRDMMDGHRPALWLSDRYAAQQSHGVAHQTCLAHLARDIADAVEASDDPVPWRVQIWLNAAFALAGRVTNLAASTLAAKRRTLDRHLAGILTTASCCDLTRALQGKISRARDQLLTFLDHPGRVEVTNNACERALRPAVVQRKVTNGYRAMWAAEGEAAVRTVVDTARLTPGTPVFGPILTPISA